MSDVAEEKIDPLGFPYGELLAAETDPAVLERMDTIIALLREIRDRLSPPEKPPAPPGPYLEGDGE